MAFQIGSAGIYVLNLGGDDITVTSKMVNGKIISYSIISPMIHSQTFTQKELSALSGFLILKDEGNFKVADYVAITIRNDVAATDTTPADNRLTRSQIFFTITDVQTSDNTRGVKRGYALVKIKRTKNPLPKVDETEAEAVDTEE